MSCVRTYPSEEPESTQSDDDSKRVTLAELGTCLIISPVVAFNTVSSPPVEPATSVLVEPGLLQKVVSGVAFLTLQHMSTMRSLIKDTCIPILPLRRAAFGICTQLTSNCVNHTNMRVSSSNLGNRVLAVPPIYAAASIMIISRNLPSAARP